MGPVLKTRIIKIGNSQGIRIPKVILDQSKLGEEVELEVLEGAILIRASQSPKYAWEAEFKRMAEEGDDYMLDAEYIPTTFDDEEWEW